MSATRSKRPSGAQYRRRRSAKLEAALIAAGTLKQDYLERFGDAPADATELMTWLARVGGALVEEALTIPEMEKRHKVVANLIAKIGLVSSKTQFAGRVEAIERRLAELAAPQAQQGSPQAIAAGESPIIIPARGTPLWRSWEARGALPAEGANVVEAPETSRAYRALAEKERTS